MCLGVRSRDTPHTPTGPGDAMAWVQGRVIGAAQIKGLLQTAVVGARLIFDIHDRQVICCVNPRQRQHILALLGQLALLSKEPDLFGLCTGFVICCSAVSEMRARSGPLGKNTASLI